MTTKEDPTHAEEIYRWTEMRVEFAQQAFDMISSAVPEKHRHITPTSNAHFQYHKGYLAAYKEVLKAIPNLKP